MKFKCSKREKESPFLDFWTTSNVCSYCGCTKFSNLIELIKQEKPLVMNKTNKTFEYQGIVFRYDHSTIEEQLTLKELFQKGKVKISKKEN